MCMIPWIGNWVPVANMYTIIVELQNRSKMRQQKCERESASHDNQIYDSTVNMIKICPCLHQSVFDQAQVLCMKKKICVCGV